MNKYTYQNPHNTKDSRPACHPEGPANSPETEGSLAYASTDYRRRFFTSFRMTKSPGPGLFKTILGIVLFAALFGVIKTELYKPFALVRPTTGTETISVMDQIKPQLFKQSNSYRLHKESSLIPQAYAEHADFEELAAFGVIDFESGTVLFEKNLEKQIPIASLTKLMTAVVAYDLAQGDEYFKVSEHAAEQIPTKIGVVAGEEMSVDELVAAAMLTSANDAVEVIREGINEKYGEKIFVEAMNEKAQFIGLKNTNFTNPQGFDGNNYSTVEDYALLSHYTLTHYPKIAEIVSKEKDFLPADSHHKQFDLPNWNGLVGVYPNVSGIKIGSTELARKTTAVVAEREGKKILVISLGAPDLIARDLYASQLLDLGFEKTLGLEPVEVTEEQLREKYATWNQ